MSQTSTTNTVTYDGTSTDGGTTGVFSFAFSHPISDEGDLKVTVITESTGAESVKAITTNYTVALADDKSSATVTFVAGEAPLSTEAVVLDRVTQLTQESTYDRHNTIENDLDKGAQADLSLQEQINRCVQLPLADTVLHDGNSRVVTSPVLPTVIGATAGDVLTLASGKTSLEYTTANASNATHTGEVTGSAALTIDPTAISNKTLVTGVAGDMILIEDATDGALKRIDAGDLITTANATHTGQVTGSGALTLDVTAISDQTLVTGVAGDMVLIEDATDGALKRVDLTDLIDGGGDVTSATTITDNAVVRGDGGAKGVQQSGILIDDSDNVTAMGTLGCGVISSTGSINSDTGAYGQTADVNGDNLVVQESASQVGMSIIGTTGGNCNLFFGDSAAASQGRIIYENSGDTMNFRTAGVERFHVNSTEAKFVVETLHDGASIGHTLQTGTGDGTTTIDWGAGNVYKHQFGAFNETFTFTAPTNPGTFILILVQDSVGSRTVTWPASVDWPSNTAPTLTTTATTGTDIIHFIYDGTNYYGTSAADFS